LAAGVACSTPFGIRGKNTSWMNTYTSGDRCAQRLSASEGKTPLEHRDHKVSIMCSTPFGIRGKNTACCSESIVEEMCAQRLSASEGKTPFIIYAVCI